MASKYDPLAKHLRQQRGPRHQMSFAKIENVIGTQLPASARQHRPWWANHFSLRRNTQARNGWLAADWKVDSPDLEKEAVTFRAVNE